MPSYVCAALVRARGRAIRLFSRGFLTSIPWCDSVKSSPAFPHPRARSLLPRRDYIVIEVICENNSAVGRSQIGKTGNRNRGYAPREYEARRVGGELPGTNGERKYDFRKFRIPVIGNWRFEVRRVALETVGGQGWKGSYRFSPKCQITLHSSTDR